MFKKSRVQPSERPAANKTRVIRAIRVRLKYRKIRVQKYSLNSDYSCSKTSERPAANKIRVICAIRVQNKIFVSFEKFVFKNNIRVQNIS